jgi:anti-anti-sigma regulatory factor
MSAIHDEKLGELAILECKGRIVKSEAVFELRDAVMGQRGARIIALDLYEVEAIGGGGLGMLAFRQRWARDHDIELKLFNPSRAVMDELEPAHESLNCDIATPHEMMKILSRADKRYAMAA